jgi:hypothetical protein
VAGPTALGASHRARSGHSPVVAIVLAQVAATLVMLRHTYFFADDFVNFEVAREMGLSFAYVKRSLYGHLEPGYRVGNWFMVRVFDASRPWCVTVELVLLAASTLLLARLLRLLIGARNVWFYASLLAYAFTASLTPSLVWWSASLNALPATIGAIIVVDSTVRWWESGSRAHATAAVFALAVGMTFYEKITYVPGVVALVILGWYQVGSLRERLVELVRRGWRLGLTFAVVLIAYWWWFVSLHYSREIAKKATAAELAGYIEHALFEGFVPLLSGVATPVYRWGSYGATTAATLGILLVVGVASLRRRPWAARGWALLAFVFLANAVIVGAARAGIAGTTYGRETKYFGDYAWLTAMSLALVTVAGRDTLAKAAAGRRAVVTAPPRLRANAAVVVAATLLAALWTVDTVVSDRRIARRAIGKQAGSYWSSLNTSWNVWRRRDPNAALADVNVPNGILFPEFYPYTLLSKSFAHYLTAPRFTGSDPLVTTQRGTLVPAGELVPAAHAIRPRRTSGSVRITPGTGLGCIDGGIAGGVVSYDLDGAIGPGDWLLLMDATELTGNPGIHVFVTTPEGTREGRGLLEPHQGYEEFALVAHEVGVLALAPVASSISAVGIQVHAHTSLCLGSIGIAYTPF